MITATLAGHLVTHARVHVPSYGVPWVEATIDEEADIAGPVPFRIADLAISCTVMSGGRGPKGRASYRLAFGAGRWGKTIPRRSYSNDAGVKASTVLADAARECGETLDSSTIPRTTLGPAYARAEDPAGRVLELVAPAQWYVGQDGITRLGHRPTAPLGVQVDILSISKSTGTVTLASESIATILPGVVVEGIEAVDVMHEVEPGSLRTTIWGRGISSRARRLDGWRRLFAQVDPRAKYRAVYEYRVVSQSGERLNLQPVRVLHGMPDLARVTVRPGISGARADVAIGSRVLVAFVDADPALPAVVGFEAADSAGFVPLSLTLGAAGSSSPAAARQGDTVKVLLPPAVFVGTIVVGGVPSPATGTIMYPMGYGLGTIETGSPLVGIGPP